MTEDWIGSGIRLNAIAPGLIATPMTADTEELILGLGDIFPIPIGPGRHGRRGRPRCSPTCSAPTPASSCGSVITMDGGTDAALRGEHWPAALP